MTHISQCDVAIKRYWSMRNALYIAQAVLHPIGDILIETVVRELHISSYRRHRVVLTLFWDPSLYLGIS